MKYYDGTKLLSLNDINGQKPEIYICTSNRSAGKTTFFGRMVVNAWKKRGDKFCLLFRFNYELSDVADKFYKDISSLFFPGTAMTTKPVGNGNIVKLYIDGQPCGYAVALNAADQIKRHSHQLSDVSCLLFDEFQSETNHYCPNELIKFQSIHKSIARGQGQPVRRVPVYMLSNTVSIINPYYTALGISSRLRSDTNFLKGDGFVLEQGYVKAVADAQSDSAFNRAFAGSSYSAYSDQCVYLNDNTAFIDKPKGHSRYLGTLRFRGRDYGIRAYDTQGIVFCDTTADSTDVNRICVTTEDHNVNYVMLKRNDLFLIQMRYYFDRGCFRFKDLNCKDAVLTALSY